MVRVHPGVPITKERMMSKSARAVPYLKEIANLLNAHRPSCRGKVEISPDGNIWDAERRSGISDVDMKEEMVSLREQLQLEAEKMDWLLSLWSEVPEP